MFGNIYNKKKVLITGHTGFKGSWLALWLLELGADVVGYSLEPLTKPNHFDLIKTKHTSFIADIRDRDRVEKMVRTEKPDIIFHLAAQPIVRVSYDDPVETFTTNTMGTINLLEAARRSASVQAFINVTSDKCYENKELERGYHELDPLGGYDPYSASKSCSEIITGCWRNSYFNIRDYGNSHHVLVATARAGNVIGGGDWAIDRLVPDIMRATSVNEKTIIRNPGAVRAWQHVLEPLSGYLILGQKLLEGKTEFAEAWNFGPDIQGNISVKEIIEHMQRHWSEVTYEAIVNLDNPHETTTLMLDCSKAKSKLGWGPVWEVDKMIEKTVHWYRSFYESGEVRSLYDLQDYVAEATKNSITWSI